MNLKFAQQYKDFDVLQEQYIKEVEGIGRVLQHQKTGLRVISIVNKDPQKVFSVAFHTPPKDNKGAPHIVEHTVCCASEQYPLLFVQYLRLTFVHFHSAAQASSDP